jgi:hypothetical protein
MARDRKRHACDREVPVAPPGGAMPPNDPIAGANGAPHPCLIQIVRLLARQAATADIAAQRAIPPEE